MSITLFSWGYYGWGNHTAEFVQAVDAVEAARGYEPPVFVDVRIRRSVRATGFTGTSFERLVGEDRHVWMKSLGNLRILTREGPFVQIAEPAAANDLLELASTQAKQKRRVIFFCSCQWPRFQGKINCHRTTVTQLLLKAAKKQGRAIQVVEWPGHTPRQVHLEVESRLFRLVLQGRMTIPLEDDAAEEMWGLPWCSIATVRSEGELVHRIVGPATYTKSQWSLPVVGRFEDPDVPLAAYKQEAVKLRRLFGMNPVKS